jgi:hypothetical protein
MADRDGERIRLVGGGGLGFEAENKLHHPLYLPFLSPSVAADRLLDAGRRVLGAFDSGGRGRDEHRAARLPDGERDAGVCTHVGLFERDGVRRVLRNELLNPREDRHQAGVGALAGGCPPAAEDPRPEAAAASLDDPVPARSRPWVDAENLHEQRLGSPPDVPSERPDD